MTCEICGDEGVANLEVCRICGFDFCEGCHDTDRDTCISCAYEDEAPPEDPFRFYTT